MKKMGVQSGFMDYMSPAGDKFQNERESRESKMEGILVNFEHEHGIGKKYNRSKYFFTNNGLNGYFTNDIDAKTSFRYRIHTWKGTIDRI